MPSEDAMNGSRLVALVALILLACGCSSPPADPAADDFLDGKMDGDLVQTPFKLYEPTLRELIPVELVVHTKGAYEAGCQVKGLTIVATDEQPNLTLFSFTGTRFARYINAKWLPSGELQLEGIKEFKATVTTEYSNGYGDTSVNPDDRYSLEKLVLHDGMQALVDAGSWDDPRWEDELGLSIPNQTVQEMCMWGVPVRAQSTPAATATTTRFRLYEAGLKEEMPVVLVIETKGAYRAGAAVTGLSIIATDEQPNLTLFSFPGARFADTVSYQWLASGELQLEGIREFKAVVTAEYSNGFGDTSVNPDDSYSLEKLVIHDGMQALLDAGNWDDPRWEDGLGLTIPNQTVEETCMWGVPVRER
jgi:hypothetical protein